MDTETRSFKEVFPGIGVSGDLDLLTDSVCVDKVILNRAHNVLKVFITSEKWISKKYIYELEDLIGKLIKFEDLKVEIEEKFRLSSIYNASNFFDVYKDSIDLEFKNTNIFLEQMLLSSEFDFPDEDTVNITCPKNIVTEELKDEFVSDIRNIFNNRAGLNINNISVNYTERHPEPEDTALKNEIEQIRKRQKAAKEAKESGASANEHEEDKNSNASRSNTSNKKNPGFSGGGRRSGTRKLDPENKQVLGKPIDGEVIKMSETAEERGDIIVQGEVFKTDERELKNGKTLFTVFMSDHTDSIKLKFFVEEEELENYRKVFSGGRCYKIRGYMSYDPYDQETVMKNVSSIESIDGLFKKRTDDAAEKRIELHCHTKMSDMDAVSSATEIIKQAHEWGHKGIAITDHGVVQAFPEAMRACSKFAPDDDFKIVYGMEAYLVDDVKNIVFNAGEHTVSDNTVVFSTVTTGSSPEVNDIIEICGVKIEDGLISDRFYTFVDPGKPVPFSIEQVTGIDDEMLKGAPGINEAIRDFAAFCGDSCLAAYNCEYEMSFIKKAAAGAGIGFENCYFDLEGVARMFIKGLGRSKFAKFAKAMHVESTGSIRAADRAECMAGAFLNLLTILKKNDVRYYRELNEKGSTSKERILNLRYYHAIILAANETGRINLYKLVSESHLNYFKKRPRIPRSLLMQYREGLILGSACSAGELYDAILNGRSDEEIAGIVNFYDYLEVQPVGNNEYLIRNNTANINSVEDLRAINKKIVKFGEMFNKPVAATCDVHFLNPEDAVYRAIIQAAHGYSDTTQPPLYLHTTNEMLEEFSYLGDEKAKEIVIRNPEKIMDMCERISPIHPDKCPPEIPNSDTDLYDICFKKAKEIYGEDLPEIVSERLEKELSSIIKNGYAVMYIIARKLVQKSISDGYLVGSRGSVGSSFVATMSSVTEVNPLPPHYYCPSCKFSDFDSEIVNKYKGRAGCDMPDRICPVCGNPLKKDGFDIPFETFLGFKGDKEPDIDLNFSGEEQSVAQAYTEEIFGKGQTFKAGTISTVADKTAVKYTRNYFRDMDIVKNEAEIERLSAGCAGVRSTTGQHPGGVIVLPKGMNINWFTPVQHPANDDKSDIITTHFNYHDIERNLLKLDILGHDDPSMVRMLQDLTGMDPKDVPLDDKGVLSLFTSTEALGIKPEDIGGVNLGVLGIPEFGTSFVIGMLNDTKPSTFSELVMISGLSHGTNVWLNNAQELIKEGKATLMTAICTRDDIMLYLIRKGIEPERAFKIMEAVRKPKGRVTPDMEKDMLDHDVPDWYIWSCKQIQYMFPKAHAVAYVTMAFRIAYFKINYPLAYYASYFSIRSTGFSYEKICLGADRLQRNIEEYENKESKSNTDDEVLRNMYIAREMYARGFKFKKLDVYQADAVKFKIIDGEIMPALTSVEGLGSAAAYQIQEAAAKEKFLSLEDFRNRAKVSKTITDVLVDLGVLKNLPESNQLSIFDSVMTLS